MNMQLPDDLGLSDHESLGIIQQWQTLGSVWGQLQQEGFRAMAQPPYEMPQYIDFDRLSQQDSKELMQMMVQNKAWRDFAAERLAFAKMSLTELKNTLGDLERQNKKKLRKDLKSSGTKGPTKEEISEAAVMDPRHIELKKHEQYNLQLKEYYDMVMERCHKNYELISRTVSLREQDLEQLGRRGVGDVFR